MRSIDPQAVDACRTVVDELQTAAALQNADLTLAERRALLAIAAAVQAQLEPEPRQDAGSAAKAAEPLPG